MSTPDWSPPMGASEKLGAWDAISCHTPPVLPASAERPITRLAGDWLPWLAGTRHPAPLPEHLPIFAPSGFPPELENLAAVTSMGGVRWRLQRLVAGYFLGTGGEKVTAVDWSRDGRFAAIGTAVGISIWHLPTARRVAFIGLSGTKSCDFSPDGRTLAAVSFDGVARIFSTAAANPIEVANFGDGGDAFAHVRFSPDGERLAVGGLRGAWAFFDVATGEPSIGAFFAGNPVSVCGFSRDGNAMVVASGSEITRIGPGDLPGETIVRTGDVMAATVTADGRFIVATAKKRRGVDVPHANAMWDAVTGRFCFGFGRAAPGSAVVASPRNDVLAMAYADGEIEFYSIATGEFLRRCVGHTNAVSSLKFSPCGAWLLSGSLDGRAMIWHVATGEIAAPSRFSPLPMAISADSRLAVNATADGEFQVWALASGAEICRFSQRGWLGRVRFAPDSSAVFVEVRSDAEWQWFGFDCRSGEPFGECGDPPALGLELSPHLNFSSPCDFVAADHIVSPDGQWLAIRGASGLTALYCRATV